jgi:hypothetical protein
MASEKGKKLPWNRLSFLERRNLKLEEEEKQYQASRKNINYACGHSYHNKAYSSLTGPHSQMAKEKVKGLPWHRESFMARAEERRIAKLYGRLVPPCRKTIIHKPSIITFASELDYTSEESNDSEKYFEEIDEDDEDLKQLIEDIDAEVDKLVVLEGFYEPLPYIHFFTLRDDEDLSSNEDEEVKDLMCRHHLHRKS